ncbi:hypothetical protein BU204_00200 [Actinophytocola xanthii]|uniref:Uncharacterized protein n=1 Tax=Actinophytocola xanthii TaxID=1912961 RepID=A0A1Q8CYF4_9PSEU|nr:hypothetical protein BU204_00200 [Actinophytocola xanthii]
MLLGVITLANLAALGLAVAAWADEVDHGAELGDTALNLAVTATLLSTAALVGVAGAWLRRKWGPRLYVAAQVIGFVLLLALGGVGPLTFVPLLLAGVLWWIAESDW